MIHLTNSPLARPLAHENPEESDHSIEGAFGLFKRGIIGSFHQVSHMHLDRYLDEFEFRYNNRKNPCLFRDTLHRLVNTGHIEYSKLTA